MFNFNRPVQNFYQVSLVLDPGRGQELRKKYHDLWLPYSRVNKVKGYATASEAQLALDNALSALPGVPLKIVQYSPL